MVDASQVTAVLGPTNTGKTHRAILRMLDHDSGMIGLPLRLLAREVYDRVTAQVGEGRVALVTGEEKRVPKRPDYWVCTVEAMPISKEVDFVAIDEVQLAAHEQRGHVFTDRLLHARGRKETWFLGADTMRPIFAELAPHAKIVSHPRLSRLTSAGSHKLSRLPPRSAVVAFSMTQVYEIAERLRAKKGGAAVVLGALSPRTRNAQVAMFQAGEVDYLVATDAIGMGLNLDVAHVAFSALRKFDGKEQRDLDLAEIAQIAGRAGRHVRDGSFGTVLPLSLPQAVSDAVENHRFDAIRRVFWRSSELDFSSLDALIASLRARPRRGRLILVDDAEDAQALGRLSGFEEVRRRATAKETVALLWDVCRVPDYRKLLFESHVATLAELFFQLSGPRAEVLPEWLAARIAEIDDPSGDIDTLIDRIANVRTFTYVANQPAWVRDPEGWQERTRAVEDRLSDALHERLVMRFVERRGGVNRVPSARPSQPSAKPIVGGQTIAAAGPFAALAALRRDLEPRAPEVSENAWVEGLIEAPHEAFSLDAAGRVSFEARPLGALSRGPSLLLADVRLAALGELGAGARARVQRRLLAWARDLVAELLAPLRGAETRALSSAGRGVLYAVEQGLGATARWPIEDSIVALTPDDRALLAALTVRLGRVVVSAEALSHDVALRRRHALVRAFFEGGAPAVPLAPEPRSLPRRADIAEAAYWALGYVPLGPRAVRADALEEALSALSAGEGDPRSIAALVGASLGDTERVIAAIPPPRLQW